VFAEVGWAWLDHRRRAIQVGDGIVRIDAVAPDGTERSWEVAVGTGRRLPVPDCGADPAQAPKSEDELVVDRVSATRSPVREAAGPLLRARAEGCHGP
jgi:hypothetical protein